MPTDIDSPTAASASALVLVLVSCPCWTRPSSVLCRRRPRVRPEFVHPPVPIFPSLAGRPSCVTLSFAATGPRGLHGPGDALPHLRHLRLATWTSDPHPPELAAESTASGPRPDPSTARAPSLEPPRACVRARSARGHGKIHRHVRGFEDRRRSRSFAAPGGSSSIASVTSRYRLRNTNASLS